ncbi:MAG: 16S rRNA (guanine(527)-N(7))-methyltransferase RsmG [Oscillospiraceae bacterium]|jgi:16S rRNA (guanine(527)-N(7))-methyltransferase RsmG|nr:16S rRNA (guanine(527)-N(7))-methyltransferase RsmG [Oscillospiraceae bacterium]
MAELLSDGDIAEFSQTLARGAGTLGINLAHPELHRLFYELLTQENEKQNLTAIKGGKNSALLHFTDSLALLTQPELQSGTAGRRFLDVGSGAGFPGIPVAAEMPALEVVLLEPRAKRCAFLENCAAKLFAESGREAKVQVLCGRAEELGRKPEYRESFDLVTARAVSDLRRLSELCLPFVAVGGVFFAMKSCDTDEELNEAENAIEVLGGKVRRITDLELDAKESLKRRLVVIEKTVPTPQSYPRSYKKIETRPL